MLLYLDKIEFIRDSYEIPGNRLHHAEKLFQGITLTLYIVSI